MNIQTRLLPALAAVLISGTCSITSAAIIATEVGNNAPGTDGDNEYVVLLNTGLSAVDLTGFDITDDGGSFDPIGDITLGAGQSLVISSGADEATLETAWGQTVPDAALFTIVTGLAGFNNAGMDDVVVQDASDVTVYSFTFTASLGDDDPPTAIELGPTGGSGGTSITPFSTIAIPEPASALLITLGAMLFGRRRKNG